MEAVLNKLYKALMMLFYIAFIMPCMLISSTKSKSDKFFVNGSWNNKIRNLALLLMYRGSDIKVLHVKEGGKLEARKGVLSYIDIYSLLLYSQIIPMDEVNKVKLNVLNKNIPVADNKHIEFVLSIKHENSTTGAIETMIPLASDI